jgi:uncharacterized membrane protein
VADRVDPKWLLALATTAFAAGYGALAVLQHRAFWTGRFDVGNLVQAVWSTAHGRPLEITDLQGRQISRLGAHFDPIVAVLAPLWWIWPDPSLVLVLQSVAVALGAPALFLLGRRHLGSDWVGLAFALVYLLYPPTQWLVVADFHPVAFATPLLLWAFCFLDVGRLLPFACVALAACLTKEQIGLVIAGMGLWYALRPGRRRVGLAIAAAGSAISAVAITVIVPHFAPGGTSPFAGRYAGVGGSPGGILETALRDPGTVAAAVSEGRDGGFLLDLLAPLAFLPLVSPGALLAAAPEVLLDLLSSTTTQTSIHFHYTAGAIPGLMVAAVLGASRLQRVAPSVAPVIGRLAVAVAVVAGMILGPLPAWRFVPGGASLATRDHLVGGHARAAAGIVALVPPDVTVSATNTLGAHLSARRRILSFPVRRDARWVVVDTRRPSYLDRANAPTTFAKALAELRRDSRYVLVASDDGVLAFRRG